MKWCNTYTSGKNTGSGFFKMKTAHITHVVGEQGEDVEFTAFEGEDEDVVFEEGDLGAVETDANVFLLLW